MSAWSMKWWWVVAHLGDSGHKYNPVVRRHLVNVPSRVPVGIVAPGTRHKSNPFKEFKNAE